MQVKKLRMAVLLALVSVVATTASARAGGQLDSVSAPHATATGLALPVPLHDQVGLVSLDTLPGMFDQGSLKAATRMAKLPGASRSVLSTLEDRALSDTMVGWVWAGALTDPATRDKASRMYEAGLPLLVINGTGTTDASQAATAIVGLTTNATVTIYTHDKAGNFRAFSVDADLSSTTSLEKAVSVVAQQTREAVQAQRAMLSDAGERIALPRITMTDSRTGESGTSVIQEITVIRDSSGSHDQYVITGKSSWNLVPFQNGMNGDGQLIIAGFYRVDQTLTADRSTVRPILQDQYPKSNGSTEISFNDTQRTTTNYGFNISSDISAGLQGKVPEASAKTSFGYTFGREHVDEKAISMAVRDYYVAAGASEALGNTATWRFNLSEAIALKKQYFGNPTSSARVTPMMKRAGIETFARWVLSGQHSGGMSITAGADIENLWVNEIYHLPVPDTKKQPTLTINVPGHLPYLSRETTGLVQSQAGNGACLADMSGTLRLAVCPGTADWVTKREFHWRLDIEGRYVNGESGRCLQFDTSGGNATVASCSMALNQRWEWRADRIYTLFNSAADDWRLHVVNGSVRVKTDPNIYQDIPSNHNHVLLNPWSNYPAAPVRGATVPNIGSTQSPIPEDWLRFRAIRPEETWRVIPIRANI